LAATATVGFFKQQQGVSGSGRPLTSECIYAKNKPVLVIEKLAKSLNLSILTTFF
jgi:hypothetical protein